MANSGTVTAGSAALASQYNNLRLDVLDVSTGHTHAGTTNEGAKVAATGVSSGTAALNAVLTADGSGGASFLALAAAGADVQEFTSSGSWVKPAGKSAVFVFAVGGGGGGASGNRSLADASLGGGGGVGGLITRRWIPATALAGTVTVTIGAGGAGGTASASATDVSGNDGVNGGATSFGSAVVAYGGVKGAVPTSLTVARYYLQPGKVIKLYPRIDPNGAEPAGSGSTDPTTFTNVSQQQSTDQFGGNLSLVSNNYGVSSHTSSGGTAYQSLDETDCSGGGGGAPAFGGYTGGKGGRGFGATIDASASGGGSATAGGTAGTAGGGNGGGGGGAGSAANGGAGGAGYLGGGGGGGGACRGTGTFAAGAGGAGGNGYVLVISV